MNGRIRWVAKTQTRENLADGNERSAPNKISDEGERGE